MRMTITLQDYDNGENISQWEITSNLFVPRRGDVIAVNGKPYGIIGMARLNGTLVARITELA